MQTSSDITEHFLNTLKCTRGLSNDKKRFFSTVHTYKRQFFFRLSRQWYDLKLKTKSTQISQVALNVINNTRSSSTTPKTLSLNSQVCTESQEFHLTRSANIIILFTVCLSRRVFSLEFYCHKIIREKMLHFVLECSFNISKSVSSRSGCTF